MKIDAPDIDKYLLTFLPVLIVPILIFLPDESLYYAIGMLLSLLCYIAIVYKYRYIYGFSGIRFLSIPSLIIFTYTIFIGIPGIYICVDNINPAVNNYYFAVIIFYFLYPAGLLIGNYIRNIDINKISDLNTKYFVKSSLDKRYYESLIVLLFICFGIFLLYLYRIDRIPLLELIRNPGQHSELGILREHALKLLPMSFIEGYIYNWLRILFIPIGIIGSLLLSYIYKKRKYYILLSVFFLFGLINNSITLEKSPTAAIFLSIMALIFLREFKLSTKLIIVSFVLVFLVPVAIIFFRYYEHPNLSKLIYVSLSYRIFVAPAEVLYRYFEYIPQVHDFFYGQTSHLFSWLYTDGIFNLENYIAKLWWNDWRTSGYANTLFIGYYWADFGWTGIIISSIAFGFVIHLLYWKILVVANYTKNILYSALITVLLPSFTFGFFSSNITVLFFTRGIILIVFLLLWLHTYTRKEFINVE